MPYLYEKPAYFSDYFDPELVVLEEAGRLRERAQNVGLEFYEQVKNALERQEAFPGQQKLLDTLGQLRAHLGEAAQRRARAHAGGPGRPAPVGDLQHRDARRSRTSRGRTRCSWRS